MGMEGGEKLIGEVFVSYLSGRKWVSEDIAEAVLEQLVSMPKNGASSSNPSATWNAHNISIFCDICIKEVEAGHRPGTHFDKDGYANIRANFKAETGHDDYERKQLKNKWDALKNEWKLWKELVGKETGLGWNSSKGTVDASQEWWNNKIQINKEYGKFRKKGISPEMEDKLDRMFSNTVATGEHAWAPSSGVLPPDTKDESIGQVDSDDEDEIETMQDIRQASRKGKKKAANQGELQNKKGKKIGGAAKLCGQIDRLVEVYETRSSANSLMSKLHIGNSISEVLATVAQLPGCEPPNELWLFATCLFCSAEKREVFGTMKDPEVQLTWLKYLFNKEQ
nr:L10-interacting MYB domain-containing protein-like [Malus domestica]